MYGHSIKTDMQTIRRSLGFCPQHDVLFASLTVREHLELYCVLKNVPVRSPRFSMWTILLLLFFSSFSSFSSCWFQADKIETEVRTLIQDVGLADKIDSQVRVLLGGVFVYNLLNPFALPVLLFLFRFSHQVSLAE
jgi:hypothetical protein